MPNTGTVWTETGQTTSHTYIVRVRALNLAQPAVVYRLDATTS